MAEIKDVRVWNGRPDKNGKKEIRVYIHTTDDREACIYRTGNQWHKKGEVDSKLTDEELQAARDLAYYDNCWHTVYQKAEPVKAFSGGQFRMKCPDCGGYDCGANCNSNRW